MIEIGKDVKLMAFNGQEIIRRVIECKKDTVYVCTENEYNKAQKENREPVCVGFNAKYIILN